MTLVAALMAFAALGLSGMPFHGRGAWTSLSRYFA
jgi:hypothetical protein